MNIAFLGDSITEGIHGCSYVNILEEKYPTHQIANYGKGGDTIKSLYKRIQNIETLIEYDIVFLFVGVNDLFGKLSPLYRIIKFLMKQPCSKDINEFELYYIKTIEYLLLHTKNIVVLPPLFIGEDDSNEWNIKLKEIVRLIEKITKGYRDIEYLDIRKEFVSYLKDKEISEYLPLKAMDMKQDGDDMKKGTPVDEISLKRGLHTTIDGVHLNTAGAKIIATEIERHLTKRME